MIVFLSARLPPLYRSLTAASNSSLVTMLTRLIPPSARLPSREQLRRGNCHDSAAVLARQCGSHLDCRRPATACADLTFHTVRIAPFDESGPYIFTCQPRAWCSLDPIFEEPKSPS